MSRPSTSKEFAAASSTTRRTSAASSVSVLLATFALWPGVSSAVSNEVRQKPGSTPTIVVQTKPGDSTYSVVQTPKIPVLLHTRGRCNEGDRLYQAGLKLAGQRIDIDVNQNNRSYSADDGKAWRTHQFDLPAAGLKLATGGKPLAENVSRERLSAVTMCNRELSKRQGAAREQILSQGVKLLASAGLTADFSLECSYRKGPKVGFHEYFPSGDPKTARGGTDVIVHCAPMIAAGTPQPRTETRTQGAPPRTGKPLPPSIESVKLRVEISQQQRCPDSVRLVGSISAIRATRGEYIFLGNQYLSPKGSYSFDAAGHRNVVATRKLNWQAAPKGLAGAPGAERTMEGWVQLNLQPQVGDEVISSAKMPFKATCKAPLPERIKAGTTAAPDQAATMTAIAMAESSDGRPASSQATGKRQHMPLRARSYVDAAETTHGEATLALADLATIDMTRLGDQEAAWGSNKMTLDDTAGSEAMEDGRCRFPYRFEVVNQGSAPAGGFVTRLRVNDEVVAEARSSGVSGDARTGIAGEVALAPGKQLIYVHIDDDGEVAEKDEKNNLRRIGVDVGCGA